MHGYQQSPWHPRERAPGVSLICAKLELSLVDIRSQRRTVDTASRSTASPGDVYREGPVSAREGGWEGFLHGFGFILGRIGLERVQVRASIGPINEDVLEEFCEKS